MSASCGANREPQRRARADVAQLRRARNDIQSVVWTSPNSPRRAVDCARCHCFGRYDFSARPFDDGTTMKNQNTGNGENREGRKRNGTRENNNNTKREKKCIFTVFPCSYKCTVDFSSQSRLFLTSFSNVIPRQDTPHSFPSWLVYVIMCVKEVLYDYLTRYLRFSFTRM